MKEIDLSTEEIEEDNDPAKSELFNEDFCKKTLTALTALDVIERKTYQLEKINFPDGAPFKYNLWGATILSDQKLDVESKGTKMQLLEAKVQVDKHMDVTRIIVIKQGRIQTHSGITDISYETEFNTNKEK